MRKTALALIAVSGVVAVVGAPAANALQTCYAVKSWCGPDINNKDSGQKPASSVPEPGTLALLAAGVTAIGGAAWRRRRAKKD